MQVDTLVKVTMKMNLREARIIRSALAAASSTVAGSEELYHEINGALTGQKEKL